MRTCGRLACIAAMLLSLTGMAIADDIRVLSVGAVQQAVKTLAADFGKESGHHVVLTIGSPAVVMQKIKDGEVFDAVIVSEPAMDVLDKEGTVNPESRVRLANTGMGVAVRAGAPVPDLSTPEAFKQALLAAKSVVYGDPTLPN
jgi:molybdate transport system substrate-binding protein